MPNTTPALDDPGRPRPRPGGAGRVRLAGPGARVRRASRRVATGRRWRRSASWRTPESSGFSDDGSPVSSGPLLRNALAYAGALGLPIVDHPEDASLTADAEANDGFVATVLGLRGWPAAAEEAAVARDLAILADVVRDVPGARLHLTHLSTARRARPRPAGEGRGACRSPAT